MALVSLMQNANKPRTSSSAMRFGVFFVLVAIAGIAHAQKINQFNLTGTGLSVDPSCPNQFSNCYTLSLSSVDALGLTSSAFQKIASNSPVGYLFASSLNMQIMVGNAYNGQNVSVSTAIQPGFASATLLTSEACTAACTNAAAFTPITTTAANRFSGIEGPTIPLYLAVLVAELNGSSSFAGPDSAVVILTAASGAHNAQDRITIQVSHVSTALSFKLNYAAGSTTDYTLSFGNVNGLGLAGVTAPSATPKGVIYYQPYTITPIFSNFSRNTATISGYVSSAFSPAAAASSLTLCDAAASLSPCTALSLNSFSPTSLFSNISSRSTNSRALGLIVAETNGASAFPGSGSKSTSAIVTFVITVP